MLYQREIKKETKVILDEEKKLTKSDQMKNWTETCTSRTVDIPKFTAMMEAVKEGKDIDWICPFCGGRSG